MMLLLDRIRLILIEEMNESKSPNAFVDDCSIRLLELVQDEKVFGFTIRK